MMNLLTFHYWFNSSPAPFIGPVRVSLFVFVGLLFVFGLAFILFRKKINLRKKLTENLSNFCFTNFIIGLFLVFFEIQSINFFSSRFWYVLWLALMVVLIISIVKKEKKYYISKESFKKDKEFKKYLP